MNVKDNYWSGYPRHIQIKHTILAHYLHIWVQHLGKNPEICYFGCFAGRGRHDTGDEGSPIRVLRVINTVSASTNLQHAHCVFVEKDPKECTKLESELNKARGQYPFASFECVNSAFVDCIEDLMREHGVPGRPAFFFIDPFGYTGIPMLIVQRIMACPKTEILFTLMISAIQRWLSLPNQQGNFRELYSLQSMPDLSQAPGSLEIWLVDLYEHQLLNTGNADYVLRYKMCDDDRTATLYYLIHATNSLTGCRKMKDVMGRQASEPGSPFAYLGPNEIFHKQSDFLFREEGPKRLAEHFLSRFARQSVTFRGIVQETIMDNYYSETEYKDALRGLVNQRAITVGDLGKRGGILDTTRFHFP